MQVEKMKKIKIDDWKPFEIEKLFTVKRPKSRSVKKYLLAIWKMMDLKELKIKVGMI